MKQKIINNSIGFAGLVLIVFAVYLGLWVCFIGGIVDVINEIKAPVTTSGGVAWGIFKVVITGIVTAIGVIAGGALSAFGFFGGVAEVFRKKDV